MLPKSIIPREYARGRAHRMSLREIDQGRQNFTATTQTVIVTIDDMDTDNLLERLAWRAIPVWRQRLDVNPAISWAWVRLYLRVIRRARTGIARHQAVEFQGGHGRKMLPVTIPLSPPN